MTHWHVTMTATDGAPDERTLPGDHPGVMFRDRTQAATAAARSAGLVSTEVRKDGHDTDVTTNGPGWSVTWRDDDQVEHTRVVNAVACDDSHQTRPASGGTHDT